MSVHHPRSPSPLLRSSRSSFLFFSLCVLAFFGGCACGGRVVDPGSGAGRLGGTDSNDSGSDARDGSPASELGCPSAQPVNGQVCTSTIGVSGEHFYCHYFPKGATCAIEWKCTDKGAPTTTFLGGDSNCKFPPTDCAEGKPCGVVFEQSGTCLVECDRVCRCDDTTGTLRCSSATCP